MAFVNLSLLLGIGLTSVPVVLHLLLRPRPKRLLFPALQFVKARQRTTKRTLQLRHWLLLALRCAVIFLLAIALARPSVASAAVGNWMANGFLAGAFALVASLAIVTGWLSKSRWLVLAFSAIAMLLLIGLGVGVANAFRAGRGIAIGDQQAPLAAVLLFDTAPRMEYRFHNQTRLQAAQEIGTWLLSQFPEGSDLSVLAGHDVPSVFAVDRASAEKSIERLQANATVRPLDESLQQALQLVLSSDKSRKEIFLFTDRSRAAWSQNAGGMKDLFEQHPQVSVYVIDLGVAEPRNVSLGDLQLTSESLALGQELSLKVPLVGIGMNEHRSVELAVEEPDITLPIIEDGVTRVPRSIVRSVRECDLASDGAEQVTEFHVRGLPAGVHQGTVRIVGEDGLALDDVRYFTVSVQGAWPVLLVAGPNVTHELFSEAVAPSEFRAAGEAQFDCQTIAQSELPNRDLKNYAAIVLLDPNPITPNEWDRLSEFVRAGGGLAIYLGHHAEPPISFQAPLAQRLIGGKLARVMRVPDAGTTLAPELFNHPILAPFAEIATSVPWHQAPVFRHWMLDEVDPTAHVVLNYANGQPAIIETTIGRGRVLTMTTPVTEPLQPSGRPAWNEISANEDAWPFLILANETLRYLVGTTETRLNFMAGEVAALQNDDATQPARYMLFSPQEPPRELLEHDQQLTVRFTDHPGAYRLKGDKGGPVIRGFAVNAPASGTDLRKLSLQQLDEILGAGRYQLAHTRDEITLEVGEARMGREFFSQFIVLCAVMLGIEQLLANRFYSRNERTAKSHD